MIRERNAGLLLPTEEAHAKPPDGARDAVAIGVEREPVRRADVSNDIHFHAVDHGLEILTAQLESFDRSAKAFCARDRAAVVERVNVRAPQPQLIEPHIAWAAIVRDVVHLAAERINLKY